MAVAALCSGFLALAAACRFRPAAHARLGGTKHLRGASAPSIVELSKGWVHQRLPQQPGVGKSVVQTLLELAQFFLTGQPVRGWEEEGGGRYGGGGGCRGRHLQEVLRAMGRAANTGRWHSCAGDRRNRRPLRRLAQLLPALGVPRSWVKVLYAGTHREEQQESAEKPSAHVDAHGGLPPCHERRVREMCFEVVVME